MSINKLPAACEPNQFAISAYQFKGLIDTKSMKRLQAQLHEPSADMKVELSFGFDQENRVVIHGQLYVQVVLQCQRCLQAMMVPIESQFRLVPVNTDLQAKQLPNEYEAIMIEQNHIDLWAMLEEEVLLNLPQEAKHEDQAGGCYFEAKVDSKRVNPFANLKQMLKKQ